MTHVRGRLESVHRSVARRLASAPLRRRRRMAICAACAPQFVGIRHEDCCEACCQVFGFDRFRGNEEPPPAAKPARAGWSAQRAGAHRREPGGKLSGKRSAELDADKRNWLAKVRSTQQASPTRPQRIKQVRLVANRRRVRQRLAWIASPREPLRRPRRIGRHKRADALPQSRVAAAGHGFEPRALQNFHTPTAPMDGTDILQSARQQRHRRPANT